MFVPFPLLDVIPNGAGFTIPNLPADALIVILTVLLPTYASANVAVDKSKENSTSACDTSILKR